MEGRILQVQPEPVGYLEHEPTKTIISVYKPIGWFRRIMIQGCFGLKFYKLEK